LGVLVIQISKIKGCFQYSLSSPELYQLLSKELIWKWVWKYLFNIVSLSIISAICSVIYVLFYISALFCEHKDFSIIEKFLKSMLACKISNFVLYRV